MYNNTSAGIYVGGNNYQETTLVTGNDVYSNSIGIYGSYYYSGKVTGNLVYANTSTGIQLNDGLGVQVTNNTDRQPDRQRCGDPVEFQQYLPGE